MSSCKPFSALGLFYTLIIVTACSMDPEVTGNRVTDTDRVTITKTTKFGIAKDGISPLKSQVGAVVMSHTVHEKQGLKCVNCHHREYNDDREKKCAVCHNGDNGYEVMHGLCVDCHIEKKAPHECMDCH